MNWNDFNDANDQNINGLIPKGTLAKVRMVIKPGGYNDQQKGWTGGYATRNQNSGSVFLSVEFVVLAGQYAKRKIWSFIGLHSEKGEEWGNVGRSLVKGILNSARGIGSKDNSPKAQEARKIKGFADLDGIEFVARIDVEKDQYGEEKNVVKYAITNENKEYAALMGGSSYTASPSNKADKIPDWAR